MHFKFPLQRRSDEKLIGISLADKDEVILNKFMEFELEERETHDHI